MLTADQYAAYLCTIELADNTIRNYRCLWQRWIDWSLTTLRDPDDLDPLSVRAWSRTLHGSRSILAQARACIAHACTALGHDDTSTAVAVPCQPRSNRTRGLTDDDAYTLATYAAGAGLPGLAVLVGLYTAARRSEVAALAWSDIDRHRSLLTLTRKKNRDRLTMPLHPDLADQLELRDVVGGGWWVFPGRHGGHVSPATIGTWIQAVAKQAGIGHVTSHQMRHTCLTKINDETKDLRAAQEIAGHSDPSVTARYTSVSGERMQEAIGQLRWLRPAA